MDDDLETMDRAALIAEVKKLRDAKPLARITRDEIWLNRHRALDS